MSSAAKFIVDTLQNSFELRFGKHEIISEYAKNCHISWVKHHSYLSKQGKATLPKNGLIIPYLMPDLDTDKPIKINFSNKKDQHRKDFKFFLTAIHSLILQNQFNPFWEYYTRFRKDTVKEGEGKYAQMPYSGTHLYYNGIREYLKINKQSYQDLTKLCLTEGEFKAVASNAIGIPTVGLGGINSYTLENIQELLALCPKLDIINFVLDNDLFNFSSAYQFLSDSEKLTQIDSRQIAFFKAYERLLGILKKINKQRTKDGFTEVKLSVVYHHLDNTAKGLDDFIFENWDKKDEIRDCFLAQKSNHMFVFETDYGAFKAKFETLRNYGVFGLKGTVKRVLDRFLSPKDLENSYLSWERNVLIAPTGTGKSNYWKEAKNIQTALSMFEKILILCPVKNLEKSYLQDLPNNINAVVVDSDNPLTESYKQEILNADVIISTPYSYWKIDELLGLNKGNLDRIKVVCDEFDYVDFSLFNPDKSVQAYTHLLERAKNLTLISATPNFAMIAHLDIPKENSYIFDFPNRKHDTTFHFLSSETKTTKKQQFIFNTLNLLKQEPDKKQLIYLNDKKLAHELGTLLVDNANGLLSNSDIAFCDTDSVHAKNIIETGLLPSRINFVTSWCLYGVNVLDNAFLHLYEAAHKPTFAHITQLVGRTRNDQHRQCYLYLDNVHHTKDLDIIHYFTTKQAQNRANFLNSERAVLGTDTALFKDVLYYDSQELELKVNHLKIAVDCVKKYDLYIPAAILDLRLKTFAQVKHTPLENMALTVTTNKRIKPDKLSVVCQDIKESDLDELDVFFDALLRKNSPDNQKAIPSYKKTIQNLLTINSKEKEKLVRFIKEGNLDSNKGINKAKKVFRALNILHAKENKQLASLEKDGLTSEFTEVNTDFAVKNLFWEILKPLKEEIENSKKGYVDLTSKDILDLEIQALNKRFGSNFSENSVFFEFCCLVFEVKHITARDKNGEIRKVWRFSMGNFYSIERGLITIKVIKVTDQPQEIKPPIWQKDYVERSDKEFWEHDLSQKRDDCPF